MTSLTVSTRTGFFSSRFDPRQNKVWYINIAIVIVALVILFNLRKSPHFWGILGAVFLMGISIVVVNNPTPNSDVVTTQNYPQPVTV